MCAELLTGAIDEVATSLNVNEAFLGLIVLPIAGNVTEHLTVRVAGRGRGDAGGAEGVGPPGSWWRTQVTACGVCSHELLLAAAGREC